jgi:hypothetical protein
MPISVPDTEENVKMCFCPDCPTYKSFNLTGILFCAKGKAKEDVKSVSCICPSCPVFAKYKLKRQYYCKGKTGET